MVLFALIVLVFMNKQLCVATDVAQCSTAVRDFCLRGARFNMRSQAVDWCSVTVSPWVRMRVFTVPKRVESIWIGP
jgi:hypothetical protein